MIAIDIETFGSGMRFSTTPRTAYRMWKHFVRKALRYAAMYESGNDKAFTYGVYARTDAAYWANILHDLTGVWPTYETSD